MKLFKSRYTSKRKLIIEGVLLGLLITALVICFFVFYKIPKEVKKTERRMEAAINQKYCDVSFVAKDIKAGEPIKEDSLIVKKVPINVLPDKFDKEELSLRNKVAKIDINSNTLLVNDLMITRNDFVTTDLRNQDYDHIVLNSNIVQGNYVDVRYKKLNGDDSIVASKKKLLSVDGNIMIVNINEKERTFINNATVKADAKGGYLYTTIYVDPQNQPAADVTYEIDEEIKKMIEKDPSIVGSSQKSLKKKNSSRTNNSPSTNQNATDENNKKVPDEKPQFVDEGGKK